MARSCRTQEYEFRDGISTPSRFIKAGGYLMKVPAIDIAEVGAGAGSIAHVDEGGLLHVGPRSAGAEPGPACYGQGGDDATVTDANVVLGFLNPTGSPAARLRFDRTGPCRHRAATSPNRSALRSKRRRMGIRGIANANMARAIRAVTVERGVDPRDFTPGRLRRQRPRACLRSRRRLGDPPRDGPALAGVFTAVGMLAGDVERPSSPPSRARSSDRGSRLQARLEALGAEATRAPSRRGLSAMRRSSLPEIDLRFEGQDSELILAARRR